MSYLVAIVPYDPIWPARFAQLGSELRDALGATAVRIDHIGSTAVLGLVAKPIIDIQISVAAFEPLGARRLPLERLGYDFRADNPERTKRYFQEAPGRPRRHIHVRRAGSWAEQFALLFRDCLRTHAEESRNYELLKYQLDARYKEDRHGYTDAKAPFIWEIMAKADRWSQEVGWEPCPSDA